MPVVSDIRSLSDQAMNLYLYAIVGWGLGLAVMYGLQRPELALLLCFPLAAWLSGLTLWWGLGVMRRFRSGDLSGAEADAGVRSVGRILAAASFLPAIVFLAIDPFDPSAWSTCAGVGLVSGLAWLVATFGVRLPGTITDMFVLALCAVALPLNATGAVSVAAMIGWYDVLMPMFVP